MLPAPFNPPAIHAPAPQSWAELEAEAHATSKTMGISYARAFHLLRDMDRVILTVED